MMNQISTMEKLLFHHKRHGCFNWMMVRKWVPWKNGVKITISIHPFKKLVGFRVIIIFGRSSNKFPSSFEGRMANRSVNHAFFANGSCFYSPRVMPQKEGHLKERYNFCGSCRWWMVI